MTVDLTEVEQVMAEADCLYDETTVEQAVGRLADEITVSVGGSNPLVLAVMNGGVVFAGKLLPHLAFPLEVEAVVATRYGGATAGGSLSWRLRPTSSLAGRTVLIVDDVLDEGITLTEIIHSCRAEGAAEVYAAVLVEKELGRPKPCQADFVALRTGDRYLFGYGMDYKGYWRNAPGIFACKGL